MQRIRQYRISSNESPAGFFRMMRSYLRQSKIKLIENYETTCKSDNSTSKAAKTPWTESSKKSCNRTIRHSEAQKRSLIETFNQLKERLIDRCRQVRRLWIDRFLNCFLTIELRLKHGHRKMRRLGTLLRTRFSVSLIGIEWTLKQRLRSCSQQWKALRRFMRIPT